MSPGMSPGVVSERPHTNHCLTTQFGTTFFVRHHFLTCAITTPFIVPCNAPPSRDQGPAYIGRPRQENFPGPFDGPTPLALDRQCSSASPPLRPEHPCQRTRELLDGGICRRTMQQRDIHGFD